MKRFLGLTAALCTICILFSSCMYLPGFGAIISEWDALLQDAFDSSYSSSSFSESSSSDSGFEQDDTIVEARTVEELRKKYGLDIRDPDGLLSGASGRENCAIVDSTLEIYSKPLLKGFLKSLWQRDVSFSMEFLDQHSDSLGETSYDYNRIHIKIFAPRNSIDPSSTNGITVETIAHELGHAVHDALEHHFGMDEIEEIWTSLNGPLDYGDDWDSECEAFFAYKYGMTDYYEDVATIYEDLAAFPLATSTRMSREENTPLYMKAKYLYTMMDEAFDLSQSTLFEAFETSRNQRGDNEPFEQSYSSFDPYRYLSAYKQRAA